MNRVVASVSRRGLLCRRVNEFLSTGPFDLYELKLFHLVAEHRNFTRAGRAAGLTQSAMTRQIRGMEEKLGLRLFERTTRRVQLTPAGAALQARAGRILEEVDGALEALRGRSELLPRTLHVGVSRTIGLAYLPGFFHAFQRRFPKVQVQLLQERSDFIVGALESGELEVGVMTPPPRLPSALQIVHRFADDFVLIAPPRAASPWLRSSMVRLVDLPKGMARQRWLQISRQTNTGRRLAAWLVEAGVRLEPQLETDNFDLLANLVSLGFGIGLVPHRVLALHPRTRPVRRLRTEPRFRRELTVVVRRGSRSPELDGFLENVLF